MAKNIQAIRGMNDYLPGETAIWQRIEGTLKNVLGSYGYSEIRLPIVEQTPLFFFFKQKTAYEISACLVGSEMCIRDRFAHNGIYQ